MTDRVEMLRGIAEDPGVIDIDHPGPEARAAQSVRAARRGAAGARAGGRADQAGAMSERLLATLLDAVLTEPEDRCAVVKDALREANVGMSEAVDIYIPEIARRLGADWHENRRSFADVTIGTARLQSLLREMSGWGAPDPVRDADAPGVALIVLENEFHTLGALVLGQQLRRHGVSVHLIVGQTEAEILQSVAQDRYDAVLISVARSECLASLRKLVDKLRHAISHPAPVVVGGVAIGDESETRILTGADHVAADAREALRKCGLKTYLQGAGLRASSA